MSGAEIEAVFQPRSVAVIGASDDPNKIGGRPIAFLRRYGYTGGIHPINPNRPQVQGLTAYPSLAEVPGPVDLAVIATPATAVLDALSACGEHGVRACAVLSSGFGELGQEGKDVEVRMRALAREHGMRIIGPNCQGVANLATGAVASFSTCFADDHLEPGRLAIVSQSGAVAGMLSAIQHRMGMGIRYWAATGNESDLSVAELVRWVANDDEVRVVEAYTESIKDVPVLAEAAERALETGTAILMLKSGATAEGKRAAGSHTGAMAQEEPVVDAFLRQHGIVRAASLNQLADLAQVFGSSKRPAGNRVAILTSSGGLGVMMTDRCQALGLRLAEFTPKTAEILERELPEFAATGNPVDVTAQLLTNSRLLAAVLPALAEDPGVDIVVVALGMVGQGYDVPAIVGDIADTDRSSDTMFAVCWLGGDQSAIPEFRSRGIPTYVDDAACLEALARCVQHTELVRAYADGGRRHGGGDAGRRSAFTVDPVQGGRGFLSEVDSKRLAREWGLPVASGRLVRSADEAVEAAAALGGGPVVVKVSAPDLPHKTELGVIRVNLTTPDEIRQAADELLARAEAAALGPIDGLLVEEMIRGGIEITVGATRDPAFGPVVLVGSGGIHAEALADFQLLLPPVDRAAVERAVRSLRVFPLLRDLRGTGELDHPALVDAITTFCDVVADSGGRLAEVDFNPVFVRPAGQGVAIADALVRLADPATVEG